MPEQSEGNNHTSKIIVFPVLHTIFFLLMGQKVDLFAPHGAIKSTLWPASRKYMFQHGGLENHPICNVLVNSVGTIFAKIPVPYEGSQVVYMPVSTSSYDKIHTMANHK